jgi:hypothetical protein
MLTYRYIGPVDEIETVLDGRVYTVPRGGTVEVSPHAAKMLDRQPSNWQAVKPASTKETD